MVRGIYTAATGMLAEQFVQDAIAGNLANLNTAGYKQDIPTFKSLHEMALQRFSGGAGRGGVSIGSLGLGSAFDYTATDFSAGTLSSTGAVLDFALDGQGFFAVQTPRGERLTRSGQFHLEPGGKGTNGAPLAYLANDNANRVMGLKGPIELGGAKEIVVDGAGNVLADGRTIDRLKIVDAPASALKKEGGGLYSVSGAMSASKAIVKQGYVEQSNVNPIQTMVRMITVQRAYDAAQRAVTAQDETLGKVVNEVGRA